MTEPVIRVDQIWQRRTGGRKVRITATNDRHGTADLQPLDYGRRSHCAHTTLRKNYRIISAPPTIGDWP